MFLNILKKHYKIATQTMIKEHTTDFSMIEQSDLVYLDSAATSQTPQCVIDAMTAYYTHYRASVHRGLYKESEDATAAYEHARDVVAGFIGAGRDEIVFTSGATAASNMLTYGLEQTLDLTEGDEIVVSHAEHHASLVPLQQLAQRRGLVLKYIPIYEDFDLDYERVEQLVTERTKIVSVMRASNVTGSIFDVARIARIAHARGAVMITDATAAVGHIPVDVTSLGVDFLYFSGHKMCGPTGVGVLYGKKEWLEKLAPGFFGGGMIDTVTCTGATWSTDIERFEAGTPPVAEVIGLSRAVEYVRDIGVLEIHDHVRSLVEYATERLSSIAGLRIIGQTDANKNVGILSFVLDGVHSHDVAHILAEERVAIRAGHHCAMPFIHSLNVDATARASFYMYNTKKDVDQLVAAVAKAVTLFSK
jgi:cysteine desulfurase/selenocysteine lyase